ncbi:MAG: thiolase family protein [Thermoplasmata archaeon]|jgi:acetyl-CoA C-acetyltransferase|nr:thiolase family protein [Thermoplasmata archaeon]
MSSPPEHAVAILSAVRTPIGAYGGALRTVPATALGTLVATAAIERAGLAPAEVEEVLFGMAIQAGAGQNPGRQVLRGAHIPDPVGGATINMVCGSGMKALHLGYAVIRAGLFDRVLVGGMESMSSAPYLLPGAMRWAHPPGPYTLDDAMQRDSLIDAYEGHELMGLTGERIAHKFHLTRAEIDAFGLRSHLRASAAVRDATFDPEMVPVPRELVPGLEGLARDESPRADTTLEKLARLKPAFAADGLLTAGTTSRLSDGGSALVLASAAEVHRRGAKPLAWVHSLAESGVHPRDVMESPIPTVKRHLERTGLRPSDFDRVEHNEAYASASLAVQRTFGFTEEQFNVHGGAIALGHPIGASGARIVTTLVHELVRSGKSLGLATLCMGGGNGLSLAVDREGL